MGKRLPYTPRSIIRNALRNLFLRSRERYAAIKRENNTCERCGAKGSVAKGREVRIEVHHRNGVKWDELIDIMYKMLLCHPSEMEVVCNECHDKEHGK